MNVSVIVPWRDRGDDTRAENCVDVFAHLVDAGFRPRLVSDGRDGPFCRSAAYNAGRAEYPADVYVFHEADMLVPPAQLLEAVELASEAPGLVVPFTTYRGQQPDGSEHVVDGGRSIGAVGVCSEATMAAVGQWDENFTGNGFDDNAMLRAFEICAGPTRWVDGEAVHLWHPPAEQSAVNLGRWNMYAAARDPDAIRALTCEPSR